MLIHWLFRHNHQHPHAVGGSDPRRKAGVVKVRRVSSWIEFHFDNGLVFAI